MRIVHVSTNDISGGAARAAYRLHQGLLRHGHDSTVFAMQRASDDPRVVAFAPPRDPVGRVRRHLRREAINRDARPYAAARPPGLEPFSDDRSMHGADTLAQLPAADVITLHWVAGFVDYRSFFAEAPRRAPVVWRLSDSGPFTGGCHYDDGCTRFRDSCGACPQLGSRDEGDLSRQIWARKRAALAQVPPGRLHIVALSRWIAEEARRSSLFGGLPVSVIPNGIDVEAFAPRGRAEARAALGLPPDDPIVMFSAGSVDNRRKGFAELSAALAGLGDIPGLTLVSLGGGQAVTAADPPLRHIHLGHVRDDAAIARAYSAADIFVVPSLQENLPNTALESLACGTPVVGFDAGGIPDLVRPGETGLLAPVGDVGALREAIRSLLGDAALRAALGARCRQVVLAEYTTERQVRAYIDLYESMRGHRAP